MNLTIDNADPLIVDKFNFKLCYFSFWAILGAFNFKAPKQCRKGQFSKGYKIQKYRSLLWVHIWLKSCERFTQKSYYHYFWLITFFGDLFGSFLKCLNSVQYKILRCLILKIVCSKKFVLPFLALFWALKLNAPKMAQKRKTLFINVSKFNFGIYFPFWIFSQKWQNHRTLIYVPKRLLILLFRHSYNTKSQLHFLCTFVALTFTALPRADVIYLVQCIIFRFYVGTL